MTQADELLEQTPIFDVEREHTRWQNVPESTLPYVGFIYKITNELNGRMYIGKKLFRGCRKRQPLKGKMRCRKYVKESDWREYWGSSNELLADIKKYGKQNFRREMLSFHKTKWEWTWAELKEQVDRDVLRDPRYYNGIIRVRLPAFRKNGI